jgi:hypothetical protein
VLTVQLGFRKLSPTSITPSLTSVRPDAMYDPAVEPVEELSDVGALVVISPSPYYRVEVRDQFRSFQRNAPLGTLTHLIHEATDRFSLRVRI